MEEERASKEVKVVKKAMRLDTLEKRRVGDQWNEFPLLGNREGADRLYQNGTGKRKRKCLPST